MTTTGSDARYPPDVTIRNALAADAWAIAELHVRSWQTAYSGIMPADFLARLSVASKSEWWRQYLSTESGRLVVAMKAASMAGFISVGPSRDPDGASKFEVYALHVAPNDRSAGIGRLLVSAAEAGAPAGAELTLWVLAQNERAQRFYRRTGFLPDGARKQIVVGGTELTELRFAKTRPA